MNDTSPRVAARYRATLMRLAPGERLAMAGRMFGAAKTLALAGIRMRYGDLSPAALRRQIFLRFYGADFTPSQAQRILERIAGQPQTHPPPPPSI